MNETFEPIGAATELPERQRFFSESIKNEKKAFEVYPESKVKKTLEAISAMLARTLELAE